MTYSLPMGANKTLSSLEGIVEVTHTNDSALDINLTAFLLNSEGKALVDENIIFYNQPLGPNGVVEFLPPRIEGDKKIHQLRFNLAKAPQGITKIAVTLTEDNQKGFSSIKNLQAEVKTGSEITQLIPNPFTTECGIISLELYLRNNEPKVKSIWQGFSTGLAGLCQLYGIEVAEEKPVKEPQKTVPPPAPPTPTINLQKSTGKIDLSKSKSRVLIEKTPEIIASISWKSGTDYDVYALVMTKNGTQIDVCTFGAGSVRKLMNYSNGAVQHMGDVSRGWSTTKTEIIKIRLTDDILAVVPVAYSAQSNGTGSFRRYKVSMKIDNQSGTTVTIDAENASDNDGVYTCVPGIIYNTNDGVQIEYLELYSRTNSENRPKLKMDTNGKITVEMDIGPKNDYK